MSGLRADMRAHMRARGLVVGRGAFRLGPLELDLPPGRRLAVQVSVSPVTRDHRAF